MKFDARRPPTPFADEKIDLSVSVGNVQRTPWYKTNISLEGADRGESINPPAKIKASWSRPVRKRSGRAWFCASYVFDTPARSRMAICFCFKLSNLHKGIDFKHCFDMARVDNRLAGKPAGNP